MAKRVYEHPGFDYIEVTVVKNIAQCANNWTENGWDTISVIPPTIAEKQCSLLLKRIKMNPYNLLENAEEFDKWHTWNNRYGGPADHGRPRG